MRDTDANEREDALRRSLRALRGLRGQLADAEARWHEPIAVVGMACRFPGGASNPAAYWRLLHAAEDALIEIPPERWDVDAFYDPQPGVSGKVYQRGGAFLRGGIDRFDAAFFNISPREAASLDPQQRLLLELTWEGLENAALSPDELAANFTSGSTGVFVGISAAEHHWRLRACAGLEGIDAYSATGNMAGMAAGRVAYAFDFRGPCVSIDTTCSSSLVALHQAIASLRRGECETAVTAGVHLMLSPESTISLCQLRALSPTGQCRAFDSGADGYVRGEGCGVVVLRRLRDAEANGDRILALLRGSAVGHDGRSSGLTAPNGRAQEAVIRAALADAGVDGAAISYVEGHGTGTSLGDPIEIHALAAALGEGRSADQPLALGSVKSRIGHLESAAGIAGLIKVILALQHRRIPPHLHYQQLNSHVDVGNFPLLIPTEGQPWPEHGGPLLAGVSSFGVSGTNAHVIVEAAPIKPAMNLAPMAQWTPTAKASIPILLPLSARSPAALTALAATCAARFGSDEDLTDIAFTASVGRAHHPHRLAVVASDRRQLTEALAAAARDEDHPRSFSGHAPGAGARLVFVFPGQGSQWPGMGRELINQEAAFRDAFERCESEIQREAGWSAIEALAQADEERLRRVDVVQPLLFAFQTSLVAQWRTWGVTADAMVGHSLGEVAATHAAGALGLRDAVRIVCRRSALLGRLAGRGAMLLTALSATAASARVLRFGKRVAVAANNGPRTTVLTGAPDALREVATELEQSEVFHQWVKVDIASHSAQVDDLESELHTALAEIAPRIASTTLISGVRGATIAGDELDAAYWMENLRQPVRFVDAVATLADQRQPVDQETIFLEISPHPVLTSAVSDILTARGDGGHALASLRRGRPEATALREAVAELYTRGRAPDWQRFVPPGRRVELPSYPWQGESFPLIEMPSPTSPGETIDGPASPSAGVRFLQHRWQPMPAPSLDAAGTAGSRTPEAWLLVGEARGVVLELKRRIEAIGHDAVQLPVSMVLNEPSEILDERLREFLATPGARGVVHAGGVAEMETSIAGLARAREHGCHAALRLAQTLARVAGDDPPRLFLLTRGVQQVDEQVDEQVVGPMAAPTVAQAPLWGLGRSLAAERPELRTSLVDLDPNVSENEAGDLLRTLRPDDAEDEWALRGAKRFAGRLAWCDPPPPGRLKVADDGVYLVTGGLTGLGLSLAGRLVLRGARHLLLIARRQPGAEARTAIAEWSAAGAKVRTAAIDVADGEALTLMLKEELAAFGLPLRGVVHAAGVLDNALLAEQDGERLTKILAPKVEGAWNLHRATRREPLDFFVLYASLAGLLGSPGQISYAAANSFLEALAEYRRAEGLPGLAIAWGPFLGTGMLATGGGAEERWRGIALSPKQGEDALERLLATGQTRSGVVSSGVVSIGVVRENFRLELLPLSHQLPRFGPLNSEMASITDSASAAPTLRQELAAATEGRRAILQHYLRADLAKILRTDPARLDDDTPFQSMGLDSLMGLELRNRIQQDLQVVLTPTLAWKYPTLSALSSYVLNLHQSSTHTDGSLATVLDGEKSAEAEVDYADALSPGERRLCFLHRLAGDLPLYNVFVRIRYFGALDVTALDAALDELVRRHEVLRTAFVEVDGEGRRRIRDPANQDFETPLLVVDMQAQGAEERRAIAWRLLEHEGQRPFDLARPPLLRTLLIRLSANEHWLAVIEHHILTDGWSLGIFFAELARLYDAFAARLPSPLPAARPATALVHHELRWLKSNAAEKQRRWWRQRLAGLPELNLPCDRPPPPRPSHHGATVRTVLTATLHARAQQLARTAATTPFTLYLSVFTALLHRLSRQDDFAIGTAVAHRDRPAFADIVGFFINTLVLRCDCVDKPSFSCLLARNHANTSESLEYQDLPFDEVVRAAGDGRETLRSLLRAHFIFENAPVHAVEIPGLEWKVDMDAELGRAQFDLALALCPDGDELKAAFEYSSDLYDHTTVTRLAGDYQRLLTAAIEAPQRPISELALLAPAERHQLLHESQGSEVAVAMPVAAATPTNLATLFATVVTRWPDTVALSMPIPSKGSDTPDGQTNSELTYSELNTRANNLAYRLHELGVSPEIRVGIFLEPSVELVVALLAVLKAGGAFLPLDAATPTHRVDALLADARAKVLITATKSHPTLANNIMPFVVQVSGNSEAGGWITEDGAQPNPKGAQRSAPARRPSSRLPPNFRTPGPAADHRHSDLRHSDNLAYIIYTSGSSGQPKGVAVSHRSVLNLFAATRQKIPFGANDVWTLFHSCAFDFSVWEMWGALLHGGRLVLVPRAVARSSEALARLLTHQRVTILSQTPSAFQGLATVAPPPIHTLRHIVFGGEALEPELLRSWIEHRGDDQPQLLNLYGITETTVHATLRRICRADLDHRRQGSPIGRPLAGYTLHVLGPTLEPLHLGIPGELFVAGAGLARGYFDRPGLSAERFIPSPFVKPSTVGNTGQRLYRTGDRARRLANGELEFLGRLDNQLKIRGYRIEPGEIEAAMREHVAVTAALVTAREMTDDHRRLVAGFVLATGQRATTAELRNFLRRRLPGHLVPGEFVVLPELPRTAQGKLDRRALLRQLGERPTPAPEMEKTRLRTTEEEVLAAAWRAVLEIDSVAAEDGFFEIGGDSLLALRVLHELRRRGYELKLEELYHERTLRQTARLMHLDEAALSDPGDAGPGDAATPATAPFELLSDEDRRQLPSGVEDAFPLARLQAGMLFHSALDPESAVYHDIFAYRLEARWDLTAWRRVLHRAFRRHPVLRTSFATIGFSEPLQLIHRETDLDFAVIDLTRLAAASRSAVVRQWLLMEKSRAFVPSRSPLLRLSFLLLEPGCFELVVSFHHAILDGWSFATLTDELVRSYAQAPVQGLAGPATTSAYRDFVAAERRALASAESRDFWLQRYASAALSEVPRWPPCYRHVRRGKGDEREIRLPNSLAKRLRATARQAQVPLKSVLLTAHLWALTEIRGRGDVVTGLVSNGRLADPGGDRVLGLFLNTLPLRLPETPRPWCQRPAVDLIRAVFEAEIETLPHRLFPLSEILRHRGGKGLFEAAFNYVHYRMLRGVEELPGVRVLKARYHERTNFPLIASFICAPDGESIEASLQFDTSVLGDAQVAGYAELYHQALTALAIQTPEARPEKPLRGTLMTAGLRHQTLVEWPALEAVNDPTVVEKQEDCEPRPLRGAIEETVASVWTEVLEQPCLSADDDFFALGGHSLLAMRIAARLGQVLGVQLALRDLFDFPTVATLARRVEARMEHALQRSPPVAPADRGDEPPLSFGQERLCFLEQLTPDAAAYTLSLGLHLTGHLDTAALVAAWRDLLKRHEVLRTSFPHRGGRLFQAIGPVPRPALPVVDLSLLGPETRAARLLLLRRLDSLRPLDLERGPLVQSRLVRLGRQEHVLLTTVHHMVFDGASQEVLERELAAFYNARLKGPRTTDADTEALDIPPPLALQYADFAHWQRVHLEARLTPDLDYWRQQLKGMEALTLPTDRPTPRLRRGRGAAVVFSLPDNTLEALGPGRGKTPFLTLLTGFAVLLHQLTGQRDLALGTPVSGRRWREVEDLVGFFADTLVLRLDARGNPTFTTFLGRLQQTLLDGVAHGEAPFEKVVEALHPIRNLKRHPLFQVSLAVQPEPWRQPALQGLKTEPLAPEVWRVRFDLELDVAQTEAGWTGLLSYDTDLFDPTTAERWARSLSRLLASAAQDPSTRLSRLSSVSAAQRQQLLREWGTGEPQSYDVEDLLWASLARHESTAPALIQGDRRWTYGELNKRVQHLAIRLRRRGVTAERTVGILLERSPEQITAVLAVLAAGGAYLPLDTSHPTGRLVAQLAATGTRWVLTQRSLEKRLPSTIEAILVDEGTAELDKKRLDEAKLNESVPDEVAVLGEPPPASTLAYVLFTSGSTGTPKAVGVPRSALANHTRDAARRYELGPGERMLQLTTLAFDASAEEIFPTLATGATLVLRQELPPTGAAFWQEVERSAITVLCMPTAYWHELVSQMETSRIPHLPRLLAIGGGAVQAPAVTAWRKSAPNQLELINTYGPTEATIVATRSQRREMADDLPIGRPINGVEMEILDAWLRPVPPGVVGELCLGGAGLARGYLARPAATAGSFPPHARSQTPGSRLYKTGDRARFRADGEALFVGRKDRQVKVRGFRVEPREIETALTSQPRVAGAWVELRGERLVAFVAAAADVTEGVLRAALRRRLPEPMVPSLFVLLEALPLTPRGKVDRDALPNPTGEHGKQRARAPRGGLEERLCEIYSEVLDRPSVGVDDNFFALGGHSLLATRMAMRLRQILRVELQLRDLFAHPSVATLARHLETLVQADEHRSLTPSVTPPITPTIAPTKRHGELPLSWSQERLWFLDQLHPNNTADTLPAALELVGQLNIVALSAAWSSLLERHEALRATFPSIDGRPTVLIAEALEPALPMIDLNHLEKLQERQEKELGRLRGEEERRPFDLARGPLVRPRLVRLGRELHVLLLALHHIVFDGASQAVLEAELTALYNDEPVLAPLPVTYTDFAAWQREHIQEVLAAGLDYWRQHLAGLQPLSLPTDHPRPAALSGRGAATRVMIPPATSVTLRQLGVDRGATPFLTLLSGYFAFLFRLTQQSDLALGSPVAGRASDEVEGLIGLFVNTLVLRLDLGPDLDLTFPELLERVRKMALEAFAHEQVPFEKVVEAMGPKRDLSRGPLIQTFFTVESPRPETTGLHGLTSRLLEAQIHRVRFDLELDLAATPDGWKGHLSYSTELFDPATAERWARGFEDLMATVANQPLTRLSALPHLGDGQRRQILASPVDVRRKTVGAASGASPARNLERSPRAPGWPRR